LLRAPKNITGEYKIPKGVKFISVAAFQNCTDLKSIIIPDTVQSIEASAFRNCTSLQSVSIPERVIFIGPYAFSQCQNLQIVKFSSKLKTINSNVFENCLNLQKIVAPSGLQIIGNNADSLQKKVVRHENDIVSTYQSLSEINVKVDDFVSRGQKIGVSGTSKLFPEESNLHFELTHQGKNINPELYYNKSTDEL
jgi:hypothetical protein